MSSIHSIVVSAAVTAVIASVGANGARHPSSLPTAVPAVVANESRVPAGALHGDTLDVALEVHEGDWRPYGPKGPALRILAFGEAGRGLQTPGPLIRVRAGTRIRARVRNAVGGTLVVHGLAARHTTMPDTLVVPSGATRDVTFTADAEGTYFYWATTTGVGFSDRIYDDAQLNGALIVDPRVGPPKPDRVFVIQWYVPRAVAPDTGPDLDNSFFTFNGMPWPNTERLRYAQGDSVRWRIINATADVHPLHLHGFFYRITARGDLNRDTLYWPAQERMAVTELMDEGTTMNLAWYADRPGAWIFHCHLNWHVVPNPPLGVAREPDSMRLRQLLSAPDMRDMPAMGNHSETGMGGLVLRIDITPSATWRPYAGPRQRLHLFIQSDSQPRDTLRRFGYALARGDDTPAPGAIAWPGPPIILHVGQPASIMVINRTPEPSQVHWHGLEIDSYYDGVAGLSGNAGMISPVIMPRDSFEVTVTPPRAGSFMYHTHVNDVRQQSHGLYGAIIVLPPREMWDPSSDLIFMTGTDPTDSPVLNGGSSPPAITLRVDRRYRVRLMNISLDMPFNQLWLTAANGASPIWTAIAKDGFDLPTWQQRAERARQQVSIGETYDFRVTFPAPGEYAMEGRTGSGKVYARQAIHVVP